MKKIKDKKPLYVDIYDTLIRDIEEGVYKPGEMLPGENQLVRRFKVSRNTLRQAIFLLSENGYVSITQGKGTQVLKFRNSNKLYLNQLVNPLIDLAIKGVDDIKTTIEINKITKDEQKLFGIDGSNLIVDIKILYYFDDEVISMALVSIPYSELANAKVDLDDERMIFETYHNMITNIDVEVESNIIITNLTKPLNTILKISEKEKIIMFDEVVHDITGRIFIAQKLYMLPDKYDLTVLRKKLR